MAESTPASSMMVLLFTDLVGSVALKSRLGAVQYARIISRHDDIFKAIVRTIAGARIANDTGDGFLAIFATVSDAVNAALRFQYAIRREDWSGESVNVCIGIHLGEVAQLQGFDPTNPKVVGLPADLAARVMGLCQPGQILMTRAAFDNARQYVRQHPTVSDTDQTPPLEWRAHGIYAFKGNDDPMEVFEVGAVGCAPLSAPPDSDKAWRADGGKGKHPGKSADRGGASPQRMKVAMLAGVAAVLLIGVVFLIARGRRDQQGQPPPDGANPSALTTTPGSTPGNTPGNTTTGDASTTTPADAARAARIAAALERPIAQRWALLVGVSNYRIDRLPGMPSAASDARALGDWLTAPTGGAYAPDHVRVLTDEKATQAGVRAVIENWLSQAGEDDLLTIFLAGHALIPAVGREKGSALLLYDTDPLDVDATGLMMTDLRLALHKHVKARRVVMLVDLSRGARGRRPPGSAPGSTPGDDDDDVTPRHKPTADEHVVAMLTSGRGRAPLKPGGREDIASSLFADTIIKGLSGVADKNSDGAVDVEELSHHVIAKVGTQSQGAMKPEAQGVIDPRIIIAAPRKPR